MRVNPDQSRRPGFIAAALVVAIFVLMLLAGGLIRVVWVRNAETKAASRRLQAEWLAESGLDRASSRLASSPDYPGETWTVPAAALGGRDGGSVLIEVRPVEGNPRLRDVRVRADYPTDEARRARHSRALTIDLSPNNPETRPDRKGDAPK